jgi:glycosyltransferase involved in cell wall biosynthesis
MDIWLLNHYALPPDRAGGTRHFDLAKRLVRRGHSATIVAASFDYLQRSDARLKPGEIYASQQIEGVRFVWVRTRAYSGNGLGRLLNMLDYAWNTPQIANRGPPPDVVVGSTIHHFAGLAAWRLARRYQVPFIFEVRDIWPDTLIDLGLARWHPAVLLFGALDRFLLSRADGVISLLPRANERLVAGGAARQRIEIIPNGVDWERFASIGDDRLPNNETFRVMYLGAHGPANGLETVLRAAQRVQAQIGPAAVEFVLVGNGPDKPMLQSLATELQLQNVVFKDPVPKDAVLGELQKADAFIFHLRALAVLHRFGISPNKLWDYMAVGRPVLFACDSPNDPVAEAKAGFSLPPQDPPRMAQAVLALREVSVAERLRMGQAGRAYVRERYNWDVLAERFLDVARRAAHR